jgi:hypothetical protein
MARKNILSREGDLILEIQTHLDFERTQAFLGGGSFVRLHVDGSIASQPLSRIQWICSRDSAVFRDQPGEALCVES